MENQEKTKLLLSEMSLAMGMQELELDNSGYCAIVAEDENVLHLQLNEQKNSIILIAAIGEYPDETIAESVLAAILKANFMLVQNAGTSLALDQEGLAIVIQTVIELQTITISELSASIVNFANSVAVWKLEYQNILDRIDE